MSPLSEIERARRDAMRTAARMAQLDDFCQAGYRRRTKEREQRKLPRVAPGPYHDYKMAGDTRTIHRAGPLA